MAGQTALVTGVSASIGLASARALSADGAAVENTGRSKQVLAEAESVPCAALIDAPDDIARAVPSRPGQNQAGPQANLSQPTAGRIRARPLT
jgi:NAD(P)-dependent dehydrogenase (short-subunit alcohol dehydrogenase family)